MTSSQIISTPRVKTSNLPGRKKTTVVNKLGDSSVEIKIYREPTHTDQYLHVRSHRPLEHKLSVVRTLLHRNEIVTDHEDRSKEVKHAKKALHNYGYKDWAFFRASNKRGNHPPRR